MNNATMILFYLFDFFFLRLVGHLLVIHPTQKEQILDCKGYWNSLFTSYDNFI